MAAAEELQPQQSMLEDASSTPMAAEHDAVSDGEPSDDGIHAEPPGIDDGGGLGGVHIDGEEDLGGESSTTSANELVEDDASVSYTHLTLPTICSV